MPTPVLTEDQRAAHRRLLLELSSIPTASGREARVIERLRAWVKERQDLELAEDAAGNLVVRRRDAVGAGESPLFFTAHLDHPAFVVERIIGPATVQLSFRGGVMDAYFSNTPRIVIHAADGPIRATVLESKKAEPFRECVAEVESERRQAKNKDDEPGCRAPGGDEAHSAREPEAGSRNLPAPGDVATWDLPEAFVRDDLVHAPACDDLAAAAAALAAFDALRERPEAARVRLLFTRAEEIGFVGAIAACKLGTIPPGSRLLALENSRSFPLDSPIGGGPIVRVGDRLSVFSPALTAAAARAAERLTEARKNSPSPFRWQRKLMAGGACEASCFQAFGHEATCLCLPLGNYHNMADLERVQAGEADAVRGAAIAPEIISLADYHGLIDLLIACGVGLDEGEPIRERMERIHAKLGFVLG